MDQKKPKDMIITFTDHDRQYLEPMLRNTDRHKGAIMLNNCINTDRIDEFIMCFKWKSRIKAKDHMIGMIEKHGFFPRKTIAYDLGVFVYYIDKLYKKNKLEAIKIGKTLYFRNKNYIRNGYPRHVTRPKEDFRGIDSGRSGPGIQE